MTLPTNTTPWDHLSSDWQTRILAALADETAQPTLATPQSEADLAAAMAIAHTQRLTVLPCGNGSKVYWGTPVRQADWVISVAGLNRLVDHAVGDLTITAEAGMKLADLQQILAEQRQFLPLDPPSLADCTLGGAIATADSGPLRHGYGGVRDLLLGMTFVRHDGQIAKAGGRVVKNVAGYDLMKLFTGSWGTLGVLSQVTFRVYPLPEAYRTVVLTGAWAALTQVAQAIAFSALTPIAFDWLSPSVVRSLNLAQAEGAWAGLALRFGSVELSVVEQAKRCREVAESVGLSCGEWGGEEEVALWQQLRQRVGRTHEAEAVVCKVGLLPTAIGAFLQMVEQVSPGSLAVMRAGTGLGLVQLSTVGDTITVLDKLRHSCQQANGFLSVLTAPKQVKKSIDCWGLKQETLSGTASIMRKIKQQFDPGERLSPGRLV